MHGLPFVRPGVALRAWRRAWMRLAIALGITALAGCAALGEYWALDRLHFETTFRKVLARAQGGDAESQNAVGYMLYYGEGVEPDRVQAHLWFLRAAEQGNPRARRNLAIMGALGPQAYAQLPDPGTLRTLPGRAQAGEELYLAFCSGCHGVNGIAAYENSPSFAFGERLEKSDAVLMRSLLSGFQEMPGWEGKLPQQSLREVLAYARSLQNRYDAGISAQLRAAPELYFLFGPMEQRRRMQLL